MKLSPSGRRPILLVAAVCAASTLAARADTAPADPLSPVKLDDWLVLGPIPISEAKGAAPDLDVQKKPFDADLLAPCGGESRFVHPPPPCTVGGHGFAWKSARLSTVWSISRRPSARPLRHGLCPRRGRVGRRPHRVPRDRKRRRRQGLAERQAGPHQLGPCVRSQRTRTSCRSTCRRGRNQLLAEDPQRAPAIGASPPGAWMLRVSRTRCGAPPRAATSTGSSSILDRAPGRRRRRQSAAWG